VNQAIEMQIIEHEEKLKHAMLQSDVSTLDKLLASDLIFTNHLGQLMTKQDDLKAHESGMLKIDKISLSDIKVLMNSAISVVSVQAHIVGKFHDKVSENNFRFTRVWRKVSNDTWQIIAGHSSIVI